MTRREVVILKLNFLIYCVLFVSNQRQTKTKFVKSGYSEGEGKYLFSWLF